MYSRHLYGFRVSPHTSAHTFATAHLCPAPAPAAASRHAPPRPGPAPTHGTGENESPERR